MRIKFLGTGGFHPNDRRETACIMIPDIGLVLDAGTAAYRIERHLKTDSLDIFLTHAHLDHICGLTYLIILTLTGKVQEIRLHAREEFLEAVRNHLFAEAVFPVDPPFSFHALPENGEMTLDSGVEVAWQKLESHPGGSTAYRLNLGNQQFAHVTDTTVDGSYSEFISGVDCLVHECYFADEMSDWGEKTGHTYASELVKLANETNVGRVIAVHPDPQADADNPIGLEAMQSIFPNIELAHDGLGIDLS